MSAKMINLLLRLSSAGDAARVSHRAVSSFKGRAFDRLIVAGILEALVPAVEWPTCTGCECGLESRPIEVVGDLMRAICPLDPRRDVKLDRDDLRSFVVNERLLCMECLGGKASELFEPMPRLWRRENEDGTFVFLTFRRSVAEHPALLALIRSIARGAPTSLVAPRVHAHAELDLTCHGGLSLFEPVKILSLREDGGFEMKIPRGQSIRPFTPRLEVCLISKTVRVDGTDQRLPGQPTQLLVMLVDAWRRKECLLNSSIETRFSRRPPSDLVRDLRRKLSAGRPDKKQIEKWIQSESSPAGYRLALTSEQLRVVDTDR